MLGNLIRNDRPTGIANGPATQVTVPMVLIEHHHVIFWFGDAQDESAADRMVTTINAAANPAETMAVRVDVSVILPAAHDVAGATRDIHRLAAEPVRVQFRAPAAVESEPVSELQVQRVSLARQLELRSGGRLRVKYVTPGPDDDPELLPYFSAELDFPLQGSVTVSADHDDPDVAGTLAAELDTLARTCREIAQAIEPIAD